MARPDGPVCGPSVVAGLARIGSLPVRTGFVEFSAPSVLVDSGLGWAGEGGEWAAAA